MSRIHIIGGPGSGKTYLATRVSERFSIPRFDLDDVFWDTAAPAYGTRNPTYVRDTLLNEILMKPSWVLEGVYYAWLEKSFQKADLIVILRPEVITRDLRIFKRFVMRRIRLIKSKRESLLDLLALLRYNHQYDAVNLPCALDMLSPFGDKLLRSALADEAFDQIRISLSDLG